ncbi:MAG: hypothetical protein FWF05_00100 [Oscillospiraceae bacterium]|nr:hypothetical protein [Oscillospiraceae bacterium]
MKSKIRKLAAVLVAAVLALSALALHVSGMLAVEDELGSIRYAENTAAEPDGESADGTLDGASNGASNGASDGALGDSPDGASGNAQNKNASGKASNDDSSGDASVDDSSGESGLLGRLRSRAPVIVGATVVLITGGLFIIWLIGKRKKEENDPNNSENQDTNA